MRRLLRNWLVAAATLTLLTSAGTDASAADTAGQHAPKKPTIVLVHGAFADSSSWSGEIRRLQSEAMRLSPWRTRCAASPPTPPT
ncbi:MAG: hypothetical protein QM711_17400 [Micropruina sp.]|uniref:hypothetical protein n=1 Tax=Micropruina sp. TaxID=2737536 RepID=UPI0039E60778